MKDLISVIVPIYNVEKYLNKCIESIINQTYKNLEIILVDDGSPDNCPQICDEYAKKDGRIKVIHKENGGLSSARNVGIDVAMGEYLTFIDSDDYVEPNFIEVLYQSLVNNDADISMCGINKIQADKIQEIIVENQILDKDSFWNFFYYGNGTPIGVVAWNKIYKKNIFKDIRYPLGKINEDEFVIHKIVDKCNKISITNEALYNYIQRDGSIIHSKKSIKNLDVYEALENRLVYFLDNNMYELAYAILMSIISRIYDLHREVDFNYKQYKKNFKKYSTELLKENLSFEKKFKMLLCYYSPSFYLFLCKVKSKILDIKDIVR